MEFVNAVKFSKGNVNKLYTVDETLERLVMFDMISISDYDKYLNEFYKEIEKQFGYATLNKLIDLHNGVNFY